MLLSLSIKNFALMDQIEFNPSRGLNVITGETGAGKSLLVDALGALTGKRMGRECVRTGFDQAIIEAIFDHASSVMNEELFIQYGIEKEDDDQIILSRTISLEGRSVIRINGKLLPLSALKEIGPLFIEIHGQHDQQAIFSVAHHIELLDRYSGEQIIEKKKVYISELSKYKDCIFQIKSLGLDPVAKARRLEMLTYQLEEIKSAELNEDEEEQLLVDRDQAKNIEKSVLHLNQIEQIFDVESPNSVMSQLQKAGDSFNHLNRLDSKYIALSNKYASILSELEDIEKAVYEVQHNNPSIRMTSEEVEKRLDQIYRLKDKYGSTIKEVIEYASFLEDEIESLKSSESRLKKLHAERLLIEKELMKSADVLSTIRKSAADKMSKGIQSSLHDLGMPYAQFLVSFDTRPKSKFFSANGYDLIAFQFSANPGEPPMPLEKIASGGEASRIMLAIKTILSNADQTHTLVFDEIDSGISGDTATKVSDKLRLLSINKQVLCVTHTAQIAAMADTHFYISKGIESERTSTQIVKMNNQERIKEVARLLSGESEDSKSIALSEQLISRRTND